MSRNSEDETEVDRTRQQYGIRKLSMILYGITAMLTVIGGAVVGIYFNDPKWFEYGAGTVFTSFVLIAIFGWPVGD